MQKALHDQIKSGQKHQTTFDKTEADKDLQFLTGWGTRREIKGQHYATSGNLGKLEGPTQKEHDRKESEMLQMKEVWQKAR